MVNYEHSDLFMQDGVFKHIRISYDGGVITNDDLHSEQFEISESLCSENTLKFGCCEAGVLKFRAANIFQSLVGKILTVTEILNDKTSVPFQLGKYKVYSDQPAADRRYRDIVAYDAMHDILGIEGAGWYNSLLPQKDSSVTMKRFRDSFLEFAGIEQEEKVLVNDNIIVSRTMETDELSGRDIITAICEINGCFGHIGRDGKFHYIYLPQYIKGLYPANALYPANNLYPRSSNTTKIGKSYYIKCRYEDFMTPNITKLQIRQEENDIGAIAGSGENCFVVENNFLVYGLGAKALEEAANNLLGAITDTYYRPCSVDSIGNPCLEVGDAIKLNTKYEIVESYILRRTLKGIQGLRDNYVAEGEKEYSVKLNSTNRSITRLKGKTNVLERNVEEMRSTITDTEDNLKSQIEQTAKKIELKVSKGEISSEISLESGEVFLRGNRLIIESDNFKLTGEGEVAATGRFSSATVDSGNTYESVLGDAGLRIVKNGVEVGRITSGSTLGTQGIGIGSDYIVTINGSGKVGYILNPNGTVGGYEERNIFSGKTRFLGKVNVESGEGISAGTYTISNNEISSTTGIHLIPNDGNNNIYLRGAETLAIRKDNSWAPIYASAFNTQSARRVKENFSDIRDEEARKLLEFVPVHFDYINGEKAQSGFIAEDIEPIYPEICSYIQNEDTGERELFGLDYSKFVPYIVALLQAQQKEINQLRAAVSGDADTGITRKTLLDEDSAESVTAPDNMELKRKTLKAVQDRTDVDMEWTDNTASSIHMPYEGGLGNAIPENL